MSGPDQQYNLLRRQVELLREQAVKRAERRQFFIKETTNPFRHATGEGGHLFDPAVQRYMSMKVTQYDHFKQTPKTVFSGLLYIMPFFVLGYIVYKERSTKEHKFRTGQVAYKDRLFKFI